MSEPIDHHYLAVFYLSRWARADGRVCRYSRPSGTQVKAKWVVPKGTGFEPRLYETRGLPPEHAQSMEKDFMTKLDSNAAKALALLESGSPQKDWSPGLRTGWSQFVLTQMLRAPEDIAQLRSSIGEALGKAMSELEKIYAAQRSEGDPPTLLAQLEQKNPGQEDKFALSVAQNLMNHSDICRLFDDMHWLVLDVPETGFSLLTSDRPIWMTATLTEDDAFMMMPIGPRKLFTAAVRPGTQLLLKARRRTDLAKRVNKLVVQHAVKYVYGETDGMLPFVQKHMATKRHSTLLERLATSHGHKIVAVDWPAEKK
jgi:hypothetical protein